MRAVQYVVHPVVLEHFDRSALPPRRLHAFGELTHEFRRCVAGEGFKTRKRAGRGRFLALCGRCLTASLPLQRRALHCLDVLGDIRSLWAAALFFERRVEFRMLGEVTFEVFHEHGVVRD